MHQTEQGRPEAAPTRSSVLDGYDIGAASAERVAQHVTDVANRQAARRAWKARHDAGRAWWKARIHAAKLARGDS